ncbi:MAG: sulfite exporter TauE/SafE family protein [Clostridium sp.]
MSVKKEKLFVDGMVCETCEKRVEKSLKKVNGINSVKADYKAGKVVINYDQKYCSKNIIKSTLNKEGYSMASKNENDKELEWVYIVGIITVAFLILRLGHNSGDFNIADSLSGNVGFIALFIIGALSSLHCVGMCGGIMMSQSITINKGSKLENLKPALKYNLGRLISYTVLGGIVGGIGKVVSLSLGGQALIAIVAGSFMIIMGMNMFGFKTFRKLSVKLPWMKCNTKNRNNAPFVVGLLNGFMPCGPLQTIQLYALGTGSVVLGAASMFFFALGTIPLMLGFGLVANSLSMKNSNRLVKISGLIIVVLGVTMASRGLTLLGVNIPTGSSNNSAVTDSTSKGLKGNKAEIVDGKQIVRISANGSGYTPSTVYIQKNMPTEIIVEGDKITSCNNEIIIPSMTIRQKLSSGTNTINLTSGDSDIKYSCWMGMKRGVLKVVDDLSTVTGSEVDNNETVSQEIQFYGLPISKVETDRLVKIAEQSDEVQKIDITSSAGNFEPAVIALNNSRETILNIKMKDESNDGAYEIVNEDFSKRITTFEVVNGKASIVLPKLEEGVYGVVKGNNVYSIIEAFSDIKKIDKELIRKKYF